MQPKMLVASVLDLSVGDVPDVLLVLLERQVVHLHVALNRARRPSSPGLG
jgi:hypothetical protein